MAGEQWDYKDLVYLAPTPVTMHPVTKITESRDYKTAKLLCVYYYTQRLYTGIHNTFRPPNYIKLVAFLVTIVASKKRLMSF